MEKPEMRGQVVILSDKVAMKLMYRQLLKPDGYTVYTAGDIDGCRDCLAGSPASVVLMDTSRDPATVMNEARELAAAFPGACVMPMMPGSVPTDRAPAPRFSGPGMIPIFKPIDFGTIRRKISEAFRAMVLPSSGGEPGSRAEGTSGAEIIPEAARAADDLRSLSGLFTAVDTFEDLFMAGAEAERVLMDILESVERVRLDRAADGVGSFGKVAGTSDEDSTAHGNFDGGYPGPFPSGEGEDPVVESPAPGEGFHTLALSCPVCGTAFAFYSPDASWVMSDGIDSDGMPRYRGESPMIYEAACCPGCFFAAFPPDFMPLSEKEILLISSDRNLRVRKIGTEGIHFPRSAAGGMRALELAAECYKFRKPKGFLGNLYLRAAWIARLVEDDQREKHYLRKAVTFYEYAVKNERVVGGEKERLEIFSLLGDLFDRLGDTGKSERYFEAILKDGNPRTNPAAHEKARLRRRVKLARTKEG